MQSERQTRQEFIDQQLARAGWGLSSRSMIEEYLIRAGEQEEDYAHQHGFADYALLGRDGRPIAIGGSICTIRIVKRGAVAASCVCIKTWRLQCPL